MRNQRWSWAAVWLCCLGAGALAVASAGCRDRAVGTDTDASGWNTNSSSSTNDNLNGTTNANANANSNGSGGPLGRCLLAVDSGQPVHVTVHRIGADGSIGPQQTIMALGDESLSYGGSASAYPRVSACGDDAYYVASSTGDLVHVRLNPDTSVTVGEALTVPDLAGVLCDPSRDMVFALAHPGHREPPPPPGGDWLEVHAFQRSTDGALASVGSLTVSIPDPSDGDGMVFHVRQTTILRHPVSGELWLFIEMSAVFLGETGLYAYRLSTQAGGALQLLEGPQILVTSDVLGRICLSGDAQRLLLGGYWDSCLAWFPLTGGDLPVSGQESVSCDPPWADSSFAVRSGSDMLYLRGSAPGDDGTALLTSATLGGSGPVVLSQLVTNQLVNEVTTKRILTAYDNTVLVTLGLEGFVATFLTDASGSLTEGSTSDPSFVIYRLGGVIMPCDP